MAVQKQCKCPRSYYRVEHRRHNHAYFEYPKGGEHYSDYSGIRFMRCGWRFRCREKWVDAIPGKSGPELETIRLHKFPYTAIDTIDWNNRVERNKPEVIPGRGKKPKVI